MGSEVTVWWAVPSEAFPPPPRVLSVVVPFCAQVSSSLARTPVVLDQVPPQGPHLINVQTHPPAQAPSEVLRVRAPPHVDRQDTGLSVLVAFWVDRHLGGHGVTLHGGCGVNSVLRKDQGGYV